MGKGCGVCSRLGRVLDGGGGWKTFLAFSLIVLQVLLQAFPATCGYLY